MKLAYVTDYYPAFLSAAYSDMMIAMPYEQQLGRLLAMRFGWSDWMKCFCDLTVIIANARHLQMTWARSNGMGHSPTREEIVEAQLLAVHPDVVFFDLVDRELLNRIRPHHKTIVGWTGSILHSQPWEKFDLVLSCDPDTVAALVKHKINAMHIAHGFDKRISVPHLSSNGKVIFVGTMTPYRRRFFKELKELGLDVEILSIFGMEMYHAIAEAGVCLNIHIDQRVRHASNMRLYEATGVGARLLTDWKPDLRDSWGNDVITYSTPEECVYNARWMLANPITADIVAMDGRIRCHAIHTLQNDRSDKFIHTIMEVSS